MPFPAPTPYFSGTKTVKENAAILGPAVAPLAGAAAVVAGRLHILRVDPALGRDEYTPAKRMVVVVETDDDDDDGRFARKIIRSFLLSSLFLAKFRTVPLIFYHSHYPF